VEKYEELVKKQAERIERMKQNHEEAEKCEIKEFLRIKTQSKIVYLHFLK
jgi:hypothetical protein